jgi:bifunctional DNA-binding transcriptional regulator/antitoxin component of YhaV-PrlF toxin-antitoxin module
MLPCGRDYWKQSTSTGKDQLTLPKLLREFLRADNGDLILFIKEHDIIPGKAKCS